MDALKKLKEEALQNPEVKNEYETLKGEFEAISEGIKQSRSNGKRSGINDG